MRSLEDVDLNENVGVMFIPFLREFPLPFYPPPPPPPPIYTDLLKAIDAMPSDRFGGKGIYYWKCSQIYAYQQCFGPGWTYIDVENLSASDKIKFETARDNGELESPKDGKYWANVSRHPCCI